MTDGEPVSFRGADHGELLGYRNRRGYGGYGRGGRRLDDEERNRRGGYGGYGRGRRLDDEERNRRGGYGGYGRGRRLDEEEDDVSPEEALVSTGEPVNEFWGGYGGLLGRRLDDDERNRRGYGGYGRGRRLDD